MRIIDKIENYITAFFVWSGIGLLIIILIIFIVLFYIYYFLNYYKINNYKYDFNEILYKLINHHKLEKKWINVSGKKILIVERKGSNKIPIIFIHGTYSASPIFYQVISKIPKEYHCITIDLPNFGISENFDEDIMKIGLGDVCSLYSDFLGKVIDELGFKKVNIVGHSLGAIFSLYLGINRSKLINELFLVSIPGLCRSSGKYGYYSGIVFKYLLPPKICKWEIVKRLENPLMYFSRENDLMTRFWILYTFRTNNGNDVVGRFVSKRWTNGYWKKPLLMKILSLKCRTNLWVGEEDFFLDPYEDFFGKVSPNVSFMKFKGSYHNVFLDNKDFLGEMIKIIEKKKETKIGKMGGVKKIRLGKHIFGKNNKSFPSIRQSANVINKNYEKIEFLLR